MGSNILDQTELPEQLAAPPLHFTSLFCFSLMKLRSGLRTGTEASTVKLEDADHWYGFLASRQDQLHTYSTRLFFPFSLMLPFDSGYSMMTIECNWASAL